VDPGFRTGYSQAFNLTIQRAITAGLTVETGYAGVLSHKLPYAVGDLNVGKRLSKKLGRIYSLYSEGNGDYNALQLTLKQRWQSSVSFLISYTYAKNMDNGPAPFNLGRNQQWPQDPLNLSIERGLASTDVRHNLVASYIWELPFGRRKAFFRNCSRICQALIAYWQFNGIAALRSGLPANVVRNGNLVAYQGLRPNLLRDPNLDAAQRTLTRYFDTSAFSVAGLGITQPGNAGRNIIRGPGLINLDVSLFKNVHLPNERELQFRVEAFNAANTPHFANPNTDLAQGQFGTITQTVANPRIVQFALKLKF
jgi:hypothetical protein